LIPCRPTKRFTEPEFHAILGIGEEVTPTSKTPVKKSADLKGNTRQFYGALAAMTADDTVIQYALSKGFYMIMPSGEDVKITKPVSEKVW
jgi:hypothetical protein